MRTGTKKEIMADVERAIDRGHRFLLIAETAPNNYEQVALGGREWAEGLLETALAGVRHDPEVALSGQKKVITVETMPEKARLV